MRSYRRTLIGLLLLLLPAALVSAAQPTTVRVGSEFDFRPYCFTDADGKPTGFGVELLEEVADRMGLRVVVSTGPWDHVWSALVAGELDVLPVVARTPGREPLVDFSLPHTETFDAFFVPAGEPLLTSIAEATGKRIVVLRDDAAHHQLVEGQFAGRIIAVNSIPEGLRLVADRKHDAFLCSKITGTLEQRQAGIRGLTAGPPIPEYKRVFSFAVRKGDAELVEKLNQGLLLVKADGTYDRIYRRWLAFPETWRIWLPYLEWALAGVAAMLLLVAGQQWLVRRRTRALDQARADLQDLNASLERRVSERTAALAASEARTQQALSVSHSFTFEWLPASDAVRRSANCGSILGLTGDEAVYDTGRRYFQRLHPDDRALLVAAVTTLTPTSPSYTIEYRLTCGDGRLVVLEEVGQGSFDADGKLTRLVGVATDITRRTEAEAALRQINATLEQRVVERTAEVQQKADQLRLLALQLTRAEERQRRHLAQILHDDLQQTLVAAKMRLTTIQSAVAGDLQEWVREVQDLLRESIKTSRSLTADLSPPVLYDAGLVAGLHWLAAQMRKKHGLVVEIQACPADEPEDQEVCVFLFQAAREMLFNVVKHAGVNRATASLTRRDRLIVLCVRDEGRGFDPADARRRESLSGFGIFSLRERVELMGGRLEIDSGTGQGTCVTLELELGGPAATASDGNAPAAEHVARPPTPARTNGRVRVLLADDHKVLREGLASLLQGEPHIEVVGQASDGVEAVELATRLHADVVVMDISMPRLDGIGATQAIAAQAPWIKVIGLSMHEAGDMEAKMLAAGAVAYARKDGPVDELVAAIRHKARQHVPTGESRQADPDALNH